MRFIFTLIFVLLSAAAGSAFELEAFGGVNVTSYDKVGDANSYGISLRTKLNFYGDKNRGIFLNINARGESLLAADTLTGYAFRTSGDWFFEGGGGLSYSSIYGPGVGVLVGTGVRITDRLFLDLPILYGTTGIFWSPYIGYKF